VAAKRRFGLELPPVTDASTLLLWAELYLETMVDGVLSPSTEAAKHRDLKAFLEHFERLHGHLAIEQWLARDTRAFLRSLKAAGSARSTVNHALCTLRHFACWVHEQPATPFARSGLPTAGIKKLAIGKPVPKQLTKREVWLLFRAANTLVLTDTCERSRPKRDRAILAVLFYTGLLTSELAALKLRSWNGNRFYNVRRKGNVRTKHLHVHSHARKLLTSYLREERSRDDDGSGYLFLPAPMKRRKIRRLLFRIADVATKHHGAINIDPLRLQHTLGFR